MLTRVLPPDEWHRLTAFEPFASHGLPTVEHWRVIVGEVEGEIIGFCCLFNAVHWEPWWIAPAHRKNPGLLRQLVDKTGDELRAAGVQTVFVCVGDDIPDQQALVQRFGFEEAPGKLYMLNLPEET
jgi:N-acetylglutamate synthase-like GNAT family acetyltransferase